MVDWQELVVPHHIAENILRASVIYLMLFLLLRFLPNRKTGGIGPTDLLVVVLLANAVQNSIMRDATAISDALIQIATIAGWSMLMDVAGDRIPALRGFLRSDPVEVIHDGKVLTRNLRREFMTEDELDAQLRLQSVDDIADVRRAFVEPDGRLSVIRIKDESPRKRADTAPKGKHRRPATEKT
ncbi:MAG TPA: YetF domain-containing protein [Candidatus Limnocylindrales bacterium]|nr:YetF domain-containing protein [Candidatus Limnocylindrales bacterium]